MYHTDRPNLGVNDWMAAIGTGWNLFARKPWLWIWVTFLASILPLLSYFAAAPILLPAFLVSGVLLSGSDYGNSYPNGGAAAAGTAIAMYAYLLLFVFVILAYFVSGYLHVGLFRVALAQIRTGDTSSVHLFAPLNCFLRYAAAGLAVHLLLHLSLLCFVLPVFLVGALILFSLPLVVDRGIGISQAISTSSSMISPHFGQALLFFLVLVLINIAGALLVGLGLLVTIPWTVLSITSIYSRFAQGHTG